jgi:DAK2 domain fusion protein YloV
MTEITRCDGPALRRLAGAALAWLTVNQEIVNALNVFPVPDGDTGTNLVLTMQAACKEVEHRHDKSAGAMAHAIAQGALMGARGNSGVILSQVWRGFARSLDDHETFDAPLLAAAMREATETAYKGVVKPAEGTILTVTKDVAQAAEQAAEQSSDLRHVLECMVTAAHESVARTPELLTWNGVQILKQAGVVDSGGKGLALALEGMLRHVQGKPVNIGLAIPVRTLDRAAIGAALEVVEPGQEWEVVVDFRPRGELDLPFFYSRLEAMGTSIQVGNGDRLVRVHIHLLKDRRYEPIELTEKLGTVVNVHMENLLDQMEQEQAAQGQQTWPQPTVAPGNIGVVAVAPGPGLARLFANLGAAVVSGGQSQNPSTEEILRAVTELPTDRVVVLPNNKNIFLAARQARDLSPKKVSVVPTRTVPQGFAALLACNPVGDLEAVGQRMTSAAEEIETGEITTATRTVELNGVAVHNGQFIGLHNGNLALAGKTVEGVLMGLLERMGAAQHEILTLYYGGSVTAEEARARADAVRAKYPEAEVKVEEGGQPHYHYILSAE